jgi:DNA mismatch repair protein MutL
MKAAESGARIARLSALVQNQIAAGEVIERPASVVKELLENALDAGAARILVELEEGGVKLVRVTDDGAGLVAEDLVLAFEPHATSKLADASDLEHIATLGFRGEALASIASVARCRMLSRPRAAPTGAEIAVHGGQLGAPREAGGPTGTAVEVRDLFFNTPARRRFLRTTATELGRCLDVVQRLALASPGVGFVATHDGRRLFDVEPGMDLRARVRRTFGAELSESLVPLEARDGTTSLEGFVAPPRFARRDTARQMWFLNGRPLRDRVLSRVLREAYRGFLVEGRQPVVFLALAVDPAAVDVNVHPAKAEVRFREERRLFAFLVHHLREAVRSTDMATPGERMLELAQRREERAQGFAPAVRQYDLPGPSSIATTGRAAEVVREPSPSGHDHARAHLHDHEHARTPVHVPSAGPRKAGGDLASDDLSGPYLQVARTYLVRALPDGFEVIDQHALHERLTFEGLLRDVQDGRVEVQRHLVPELVEVSPAQAAAVEEHLETLARAGLELARFGERTIAVHGLPARLRRVDAEGLVRDVVERIERAGKAPGAGELLEEVLHSAACRASVMAGDELCEAEIRALLERASAAQSDQTCPHARPTRVRFTLADLERAFHRR